jgi:sulfur carrier protein
MQIMVNRVLEEYPDESLTVRQLLDRKGWNFPLLIVQVNGVLVERADYETTVVRDGGEVDLHHLVSGG